MEESRYVQKLLGLARADDQPGFAAELGIAEEIVQVVVDPFFGYFPADDQEHGVPEEEGAVYHIFQLVKDAAYTVPPDSGHQEGFAFPSLAASCG